MTLCHPNWPNHWLRQLSFRLNSDDFHSKRLLATPAKSCQLLATVCNCLQLLSCHHATLSIIMSSCQVVWLSICRPVILSAWQLCNLSAWGFVSFKLAHLFLSKNWIWNMKIWWDNGGIVEAEGGWECECCHDYENVWACNIRHHLIRIDISAILTGIISCLLNLWHFWICGICWRPKNYGLSGTFRGGRRGQNFRGDSPVGLFFTQIS